MPVTTSNAVGMLIADTKNSYEVEDQDRVLRVAVGRPVRLTVKRNIERTRAALAMTVDEDSKEFAEEFEKAVSKRQNYSIYGILDGVTVTSDITYWQFRGWDEPQGNARFDDWTLEVYNA